MRFKVDENLPMQACQVFQEAGHDALSVFDQALGGDPDSSIAAVCKSEDRVLVTLDTDFGNILAYPPGDYPGFVVIRTDNQSKPTVLQLVRRIVTAIKTESPEGALWIVETTRIRIRSRT